MDLYEVLRYAPEHSWNAYEEALKTNPVLAKMVDRLLSRRLDCSSNNSLLSSNHDSMCLENPDSVLKGNPSLSLTARECLDQASSGSHSMDHFLITITNFVRL